MFVRVHLTAFRERNIALLHLDRSPQVRRSHSCKGTRLIRALQRVPIQKVVLCTWCLAPMMAADLAQLCIRVGTSVGLFCFPVLAPLAPHTTKPHASQGYFGQSSKGGREYAGVGPRRKTNPWSSVSWGAGVSGIVDEPPPPREACPHWTTRGVCVCVCVRECVCLHYRSPPAKRLTV